MHGERELSCLFIDKCCRNECDNSRGICELSVPGKIYGTVLIERLMQVTEKVSHKHWGFRKGKLCVNQIFAVKLAAEEYVGKDGKLHASLMDLQKAYDRVDREGL